MPKEDCPDRCSDENDYEKDHANNEWSAFILWNSLEPLKGSHALYSIGPPQQLINVIRICWKSGLRIIVFYQFWMLLYIKLYKIVNSILCFTCNTRKCKLRITSEFCQPQSYKQKMRFNLSPGTSSFPISCSMQKMHLFILATRKKRVEIASRTQY